MRTTSYSDCIVLYLENIQYLTRQNTRQTMPSMTYSSKSTKAKHVGLRLVFGSIPDMGPCAQCILPMGKSYMYHITHLLSGQTPIFSIVTRFQRSVLPNRASSDGADSLPFPLKWLIFGRCYSDRVPCNESPLRNGRTSARLELALR